MAYELVIGDRMYSSWSLRGWLLFAAFGIPVSTRLAPMYSPQFAEELKAFAPSRLVPAMKSDGRLCWDSLAMAETLAAENPQAGLWPANAADRALARSITAEMHSGFSSLRGTCPMTLRARYDCPDMTDALSADLERLQTLWSLALERSGGPWLFGSYTAADAFFAPVAARIAGWSLPVLPASLAYVKMHLAHLPFRQWRAMAFAADRPLAAYETPARPEHPWPGPAPLPAEPVTGATAANSDCPFSGKPVQPDSLARIDGHVIGFCNRFCRDKSVADAEAWPELKALLQGL
ncbi:glutathione S-transferase family protein [Algicella marina]|uniref:Glutathione S-transferase n=1 Tax=Algicella marina TaxID=2683284 RepID=A0A6P1T3R7_9RHOB|nr:glutathione S-transferase family protein [Algicella marina]QHQ35919.1 glutathione S-transferase [Algicella marina]